ITSTDGGTRGSGPRARADATLTNDRRQDNDGVPGRQSSPRNTLSQSPPAARLPGRKILWLFFRDSDLTPRPAGGISPPLSLSPCAECRPGCARKAREGRRRDSPAGRLGETGGTARRDVTWTDGERRPGVFQAKLRGWRRLAAGLVLVPGLTGLGAD